jgi:WD40 repeat protein
MDQAHKEQIYDIEAIGNMLYSTSMKNLKVWDLNTMQLISDIKAHNGVIK